MVFKQYRDVREFYGDTYNLLMRHEAQNIIPLGNIIIGYEGKDKTGWRDPANWYMAAVSDGTGIRLTAIMTPPHNMTLYATDNEMCDAALKCLIEGIAGTPCPGVTSTSALAGRFAEIYSAAHGLSSEICVNQRIYELTEVENVPGIGTLRPAKESDMSFLPFWTEGFNEDCFNQPLAVNSDAEIYRYHITSGNLFILEHNGTAVSMAKITRQMQSCCGIAFVYTPPYFRGRGYATSCVAGVSLTALSRGFKKCVLYTDLSNPTSNSIYQKIGYRPLCDSLDIKFNKKDGCSE